MRGSRPGRGSSGLRRPRDAREATRHTPKIPSTPGLVSTQGDKLGRVRTGCEHCFSLTERQLRTKVLPVWRRMV